MKLIADSGSTKTDWVVLDGNNEIISFQTEGLNPFFKNSETIYKVLMSVEEIQSYKEKIKAIFFYGAGCSSTEMNNVVYQGLKKAFPQAHVHVKHDLLGASIALCGNQKGICAILGTGSNSCVFDGEKIIEEQVSLGYILGDEGAGTDIGKRLLKDYLYQTMPRHLSQELSTDYHLTKTKILQQIYQSEAPNRYLASFARWVGKRKKNEAYLRNLVEQSFQSFITTHIIKYPDYKQYTFNVVGSVAYHFQEELTKVATQYHLKIGEILQKPIEGLITYHKKN